MFRAKPVLQMRREISRVQEPEKRQKLSWVVKVMTDFWNPARRAPQIAGVLAAILLVLLCPVPGRAEETDGQAVLSFTGDCCISTYQGRSAPGSLNWYARSNPSDYFFKNVAEIFRDDDITVVNCETVLTDRALRPRKNGGGFYRFRGPAANAKIFSSSGVEIAGVANNHTGDYGQAGMRDTLAALQAQGITPARANVPVYMKKNGITFGFLACGIWTASQAPAAAKIVRSMAKVSDVQIVYPHGGKESVRVPEKWRMTAFRQLIDAGADLVVGSHAHVLQPMEQYHGKTIVYGLGNFCFGGNRHPENRTAIFQVRVTKDGDGTFACENRLIPCYVYTGKTNNWKPAPMSQSDANYQKIMDFMAWKRRSPV